MKITFCLFTILLCLVFLLNLSFLSHSSEENKEKIIYVINIKETIDLGLSAFVKRAISEAKAKKADAVIFEINTFGGRVDAANEIVDEISGLTPIPTYAFITNSAWSAGALIALACKEIVMKKGASIGSAEPRTMGFSGQDQTSDEKITSALRAKFKATAEANKHSGNIAQAMVDKDITLIRVEFKNEVMLLTQEELTAKKEESGEKYFKNEKIICPKDKLLNLTAEEAKDLNLAKTIVDNDAEFFDYINKELFPGLIEKAKIFKPDPTWSENLVRFLTHPIVSSLLLSLGFLGIFFELKMPGWGLSGTLGVIFFILFFWGHYLSGLANWVDILIFCIGITLLFAEIFVTPGFGLLGALGIILVISGLTLMMVKYPFTFPQLQFATAFSTMAKALLITFLVILLSFKYFSRTAFWKKIRLEAREEKELGFQIKSLPENITVGTIGQAKTILRPAGRAFFNNLALDVTTHGNFVQKGEKIKIVKIEGNKIFVDEIKEA